MSVEDREFIMSAIWFASLTPEGLRCCFRVCSNDWAKVSYQCSSMSI